MQIRKGISNMTPNKDQDIFDNEDFKNGNSGNSQSIDDKINEIERRIRNLYENKIPEFLTVNQNLKTEDFNLKEKLETVNEDIKQLSTDLKSKSPDLAHLVEKKQIAAVDGSNQFIQESVQSEEIN